MVDIHSHILPGLDDGAPTVEEALAMLRLAAGNGTTDMVATPHANSQYAYDVSAVGEAIADLSAAAGGAVRIHRGCDFHLNFDNLTRALAEPARYSVNGGRYLMVELPDLPSLPVMRTVLSRLLGAGLVPVVTHPERNGPLCANLDELYEWICDGCLAQVTAQSFLGRFGGTAQRAAETLMNAGAVHFVASDAHDSKDRTPNLAPAYRHVAEHWGREAAEALFCDNPAAVITDQPIFVSAPRQPLKKSRFAFWK